MPAIVRERVLYGGGSCFPDRQNAGKEMPDVEMIPNGNGWALWWGMDRCAIAPRQERSIRKGGRTGRFRYRAFSGFRQEKGVFPGTAVPGKFSFPNAGGIPVPDCQFRSVR